MGPFIKFTNSAAKHGYSEAEIIHAVINAVATTPIAGRGGQSDPIMFIGRPAPAADHYLEVLAEVDSKKSQIKIFHAMKLKPQLAERLKLD